MTREIDGGPAAATLTGAEAWAGIQSGVDVTLTAGGVNALPRTIASVTGLQAALDAKAAADIVPVVGDKIIYVGRGAGASDANSGLTPGKAKATLAAACAALTTGGLVQMLAGTFDLTFASHPDGPGYQVGAVVYSKTTIRGLGAVSIVRIANGQGNGYALMNRTITAGGDEGIVFEDFTIDGNNTNQGSSIQHGITLLRATNCKFNRVSVKNCRGTALSGANESFHFDAQLCSNISYTQCHAYGTAGSTASGFAANASTGIRYDGCKAWGMSVTNGFSHNQCVDTVHVNCHAYLNAAIGFNSESSIGTIYDSCTGGGVATTGNISYPYTSGQSLGNYYGFVLNESVDAMVSNCKGVNNQHGLWVSGTTSSGRIAGGNYSQNGVVGIYFNGSAEKRFKVTGSPIVTGNTSSPYAYTSLGFTNGPGIVIAPTVPATTVALTNPYPFDATVFVNGGTVTAVNIDGGVPAGPVSGAFPLPWGKTITLTYSVAPTWVWYLQ